MGHGRMRRAQRLATLRAPCMCSSPQLSVRGFVLPSAHATSRQASISHPRCRAAHQDQSQMERRGAAGADGGALSWDGQVDPHQHGCDVPAELGRRASGQQQPATRGSLTQHAAARNARRHASQHAAPWPVCELQRKHRGQPPWRAPAAPGGALRGLPPGGAGVRSLRVRRAVVPAAVPRPVRGQHGGRRRRRMWDRKVGALPPEAPALVRAPAAVRLCWAAQARSSRVHAASAAVGAQLLQPARTRRGCGRTAAGSSALACTGALAGANLERRARHVRCVVAAARAAAAACAAAGLPGQATLDCDHAAATLV
eukprot:310664-Chlamydomonas_euryale.AAC.5